MVILIVLLLAAHPLLGPPSGRAATACHRHPHAPSQPRVSHGPAENTLSVAVDRGSGRSDPADRYLTDDRRDADTEPAVPAAHRRFGRPFSPPDAGSVLGWGSNGCDRL